MADNPIQRLKQLDHERAQLISSAKKEALEKATAAVGELNALGFDYRLVDGVRMAPRVARRARQTKDAPCPVCKFKTSPPHDARKHRGQGKRKKPFTSAEMHELGLAKA